MPRGNVLEIYRCVKPYRFRLMTISALDLFKIGIGPSSSHTVGPMSAALSFVTALQAESLTSKVARVKAQMYGSLGATGNGHGTPKAVLLGLMGESPESVDITTAEQRAIKVKEASEITLMGGYKVAFDYAKDLILYRKKTLAFHSNGMCFTAFDIAGGELLRKVYYSVGGGFVIDESLAQQSIESEQKDVPQDAPIVDDDRPLIYPFSSAKELLALAEKHNLPISSLVLENESAWRDETQTKAKLLEIWSVMQECVKNGLQNEGTLPGGLKVQRRSKELHKKLLSEPEKALADPLSILDWVSLYALAVNEENAAGGRIVTAPTNGAAGIIPAVLHYYMRFIPNASNDGVVRFLLTAAAIGVLYKKNASISGAEVGCQGEVGSACSMAAGALAEVLGGTPQQVENAAEIAMEHNLGLTCDPIGGLVQVPCIERNAMASVKAIHAARMALRGDGSHYVSLDKVIKTMRDTGRDMQDKYKETARGGLALNVIEVPVSVVEC